jgi:hypothetical protein
MIFRKTIGDGIEIDVEQDEVLLGWSRLVFEVGIDQLTGAQVRGVNNEVMVVRACACACAFAKVMTNLKLNVVYCGGGRGA